MLRGAGRHTFVVFLAAWWLRLVFPAYQPVTLAASEAEDSGRPRTVCTRG